MIFNRKK